MKTDTADIISLFYTITEIVGNNQVFKCSCGTERKQKKGAGYSNLMSHLKDKHGEWESVYNQEFKNIS